MTYSYAVCAVHITIFSTGGEILPSFEYYVVARSYSRFFAPLGVCNVHVTCV